MFRKFFNNTKMLLKKMLNCFKDSPFSEIESGCDFIRLFRVQMKYFNLIKSSGFDSPELQGLPKLFDPHPTAPTNVYRITFTPRVIYFEMEVFYR